VSLLGWARDTLIRRLRKRSVLTVVRAACWVGLVALAIMAASIIYPAPLPVIFAMSVGQVIGIIAFLCYLFSILMDIIRGPDHAPDAPGPARRFSASKSASDAADSA